MRAAVLFLLLVPVLACAPEEPAEPVTFTLLTANVGNVLLACEGYAYNLCHVDVERRATEAIAALAPDVILLQEVVSDAQCEALLESDPALTCHPEHRATEPSQARRLVGDGYSLTCDAREGFECVAVKSSFGAISGCAEGARCDDAETPPAPEGCDEGFSVSAVAVVPHAGEGFRVVNGHPASGFGAACRAAQLQQAFGQLAGEGQALVGGDMNVDPFRDNDEAVLVWDEHVGDDERFRYHSGPKEHQPPYPTSVNPLSVNVLDHVVSDFAEGTCVTLGEAPDTDRLDGGEGMDHRALSCRLTAGPAPHG